MLVLSREKCLLQLQQNQRKNARLHINVDTRLHSRRLHQNTNSRMVDGERTVSDQQFVVHTKWQRSDLMSNPLKILMDILKELKGLRRDLKK